MELNISGLQVRACKTFVLFGGGRHINAAIHTLSREHTHTQFPTPRAELGVSNFIT